MGMLRAVVLQGSVLGLLVLLSIPPQAQAAYDGKCFNVILTGKGPAQNLPETLFFTPQQLHWTQQEQEQRLVLKLVTQEKRIFGEHFRQG